MAHSSGESRRSRPDAEPVFEFVIDDSAAVGDVLRPLASLLLALAKQEADEGISVGVGGPTAACEEEGDDQTKGDRGAEKRRVNRPKGR
jgi:hypothetical protein